MNPPLCILLPANRGTLPSSISLGDSFVPCRAPRSSWVCSGACPRWGATSSGGRCPARRDSATPRAPRARCARSQIRPSRTNQQRGPDVDRFRDARASLDPPSRAPSDRPRPSTRRRSSPSRSSSRRRPLGTSRWTARRNERSDEAGRATRRRNTTRTERRRGVEARPGATTRNPTTPRRVRRMSRCGARRSSTKSWTDAR